MKQRTKSSGWDLFSSFDNMASILKNGGFGGGFTLIATFFTLVRIAQIIVESKASAWTLVALIFIAVMIAVIGLIAILACIIGERISSSRLHLQSSGDVAIPSDQESQ